MTTDFLQALANAIEAVRKHRTQQLGTSPLCHHLPNLLQHQSGLADDELAALSPVARGEYLRELLVAVIDGMQPIGTEDVNHSAWRHYIILKEYFVLSREWGIVAHRLALARARFYDYRKLAINTLAANLLRLERERAEKHPSPRDNLPHPPYIHYVPRDDDNGHDYVETIIEKLKIGRAWFIASDGAPGVGKTTVAYETALRCKERRLFDVIIWTSAKQQILRTPDLIPVATYVTSINTILDLIGTTAGNREILSVEGYSQKYTIAQRLLSQERCLLIVDNLESLDKEEQQKICTFLENLPRPSKALITGRERHYVGLYTITLMGMKEAEALRFMYEEAERRSVTPLTEEEARAAYRATQGNPLAMQQIIGLIQILGCNLEDTLIFGEVENHDKLLDFMYAEAYDKLRPHERQLLHVLPLFTDPAGMAAVEAASDIHGVQLTLGLQQLYRAFVIQRVGETRYDLLPFARQFLRSRQRRADHLHAELSLVDFLTAAHQRLVAHYLEYLQEMNLDQQLRYLKDERRNILGLMEWCYANAEWQHVRDLVDQMSRPLGTLRYLEVMIEWGKRGMEACAILDDHEQHEWFKLYCVAWPHIHLEEKRRAKAREMIEESAKVAQEFGYSHLQALALRNLGRVIMRDGDYTTALELLQESLTIWLTQGDFGEGWIAHTLSAIGEAQYHLGRYDEALDILLQAWRLRKQQGDTDGLIATTSDLALVLLAKDEDSRALRWSDNGLARAARIKKPARAYAYAHQRRAELEQLRKNPAAAHAHALEAIHTYEALGMVHWVKTINHWLTTLVQDPTTLHC